MKRVSYNDRAYNVISMFMADTIEHLRLRPLGFGGKPGRGTDIIVPSSMVQPVQRGSIRHIKGTLPHRDRRPVYIDLDTGAETIRVRLKGKRRALTCTFAGLFDVLCRQEAMNTKRDRAFRKRTGKRK